MIACPVTGCRWTACARPNLVRRFLEVSQVGGRLVLLGRHQETIRAQHISLLADYDMIVVLGTIVIAPERSFLVWFATVCFVDGPRTRQCMVDYRDIVMEDIRIGFVQVNSLLDDGLIVLVQQGTAAVKSARPPERAVGLGFEQIIAADPLGIDPFADGITKEGRLQIRGPIAPVGIDATIVVDVWTKM